MVEPSAPSIFLVFLAGIVTILKPCCLPLVPAIFSGSAGHRLRPVAIVSGLTLSFTTMGVLVSAFGATFGRRLLAHCRWISLIMRANSPDSNNSIVMSQPPISSPLMNNCGNVGQFE